MSLIKQEVMRLCRVCESTDFLVDICSEGSEDILRTKLHSIANFQDKYSFLLKYICYSCILKLENAYDFIKQCEFTYKKYVDQIEYKTLDEKHFCSNSNITDLPEHYCEDRIVTKMKKDINEEPISGLEINEGYCDVIPPELSYQHQKRVKNVNISRSYECDLCAKKFGTKKKLEYHIEGYHLKLKRYTCDICDAKFRYQSTMYKHKHIHTQETFPCDICGKIFITKAYMLKHKTAHQDMRKKKHNLHLCHLCGQGTTSLNHYIEHLRLHSGLRPFKCDKCGKGFAQKQGLRLHSKTHSDAREFACNTCSKAFRRSSHLKNHLVTHSGAKNFACKICDKTYTTAGSLSIHMRLHTGENPYQCQNCSTKFRLRKTLRSHMKKCTDKSESPS
ncbi:zinc finger protein 62 homolog [Lutzomyia longipalpis]|uniref:zinc finger protein 62 homolog n=1 Tax=Lutzomyia longipalpis TaxID=7200 RepID=UPI002483BCFC|nr:zinc finger protein 62 homolog [Lutzomyia longipalpis]